MKKRFGINWFGTSCAYLTSTAKKEKNRNKKKRMGNAATFGHLNSLRAVVSDLFQFNAFFGSRSNKKKI